MDGQLNLRTISPRHLEACATRTPQILVEGSYSGILQAGRHYIPLKPDFSNLAAVVDDVERGDDRRDLAEQAYTDVVASGAYGYEGFVRTVLSAAPAVAATKGKSHGILIRGLSAWEHANDGPTWGWVRVRQRIRPLARAALRRTGLLPSVMNARSARRERRLRES
jgi:hypothetical protein